jgi:hypothetical protein
MSEKKSILEEALLDIKHIQTALNTNTKGILLSIAKEEIDNVVKESMKKEIYSEEEIAMDDLKSKMKPKMESKMKPEMEDESYSKMEEEMYSKMKSKMKPEMEDESYSKMESKMKSKMKPEMEDESYSKMKPRMESKMKSEMEDESYSKMEEGMYSKMKKENYSKMKPEMEEENEEESYDYLDMTTASDDDIIAIYKRLSGDDEIEVIGDEIKMNIKEPGEYIIKTYELETPENDLDSSMDDEEDEMDDEDDINYEIEMDDEENEPTDLEPVADEENEEGDENEDEEEEEELQSLEEKISIGIGKSVGNHRNPTINSTGAPSNPKAINESLKEKQILLETKRKYNLLLTEANKIKKENEEFRKALKEFKTKLVETVVFNSNLSYITRLFTEHTTTKNEKQNILKRFDEEVSNIEDSKKLFKRISNELVSRKPITESINKKIITESNSGTSKQLNESTAYVDPTAKRIIDLIGRVNNINNNK